MYRQTLANCWITKTKFQNVRTQVVRAPVKFSDADLSGTFGNFQDFVVANRNVGVLKCACDELARWTVSTTNTASVQGAIRTKNAIATRTLQDEKELGIGMGMYLKHCAKSLFKMDELAHIE